VPTIGHLQLNLSLRGELREKKSFLVNPTPECVVPLTPMPLIPRKPYPEKPKTHECVMIAQDRTRPSVSLV
jgi:hypothetical protein